MPPQASGAGAIAQKLLPGQTVYLLNSNRRRSNRTEKMENIRFDGARFRRDIAAQAMAELDFSCRRLRREFLDLTLLVPRFFI